MLEIIQVLMKILSINQLQPRVAFHIVTSHLTCSANQMTGFYIKCNTGLKWLSQATGVVNKLLITLVIHLLFIYFSCFK